MRFSASSADKYLKEMPADRQATFETIRRVIHANLSPLRRFHLQALQKRCVRCTALFLAVLLLLTAFGTPARAEDNDLEKAGDILQIAIPAAGFFGTYVADDSEGRIQFFQTYLSSVYI